jgi:hypothetical protein
MCNIALLHYLLIFRKIKLPIKRLYENMNNVRNKIYLIIAKK